MECFLFRVSCLIIFLADQGIIDIRKQNKSALTWLQTFPQQFLCIPSHARCAHRFLSSGYSTIVQADQKNKETPDFKGFLKKIERVMGIEPTYPAWKAGVLPLNYTRISVGVTGFEPATSWSQTRRSSQAEPHPESIVFHYTFKTSYRFRVSLVKPSID